MIIWKEFFQQSCSIIYLLIWKLHINVSKRLASKILRRLVRFSYMICLTNQLNSLYVRFIWIVGGSRPLLVSEQWYFSFTEIQAMGLQKTDFLHYFISKICGVFHVFEWLVYLFSLPKRKIEFFHFLVGDKIFLTLCPMTLLIFMFKHSLA